MGPSIDGTLYKDRTMTKVYNNKNVYYGLNDPLPVGAPQPIISNRAPTANDSAEIGTLWINKTANASYTLTSITNSLAVWTANAGGGGAFTSLTVTPGPISLTGNTTINTTGAAATTIGTGGTGAVNIGNATGNTAVTGALSTTTTLSAGTTVTAGTGITATTGNIIASTGNITATAGAVSAGTTVTAGTGMTVTTGNLLVSTGNITATVGSITANGGNIIATVGDLRAGANIELLGAGSQIGFQPGPIITAGAGAPAGVAPQGSLYLRTNGTGTNDRAYINTDGATTWTAIVTVA